MDSVHCCSAAGKRYWERSSAVATRRTTTAAHPGSLKQDEMRVLRAYLSGPTATCQEWLLYLFTLAAVTAEKVTAETVAVTEKPQVMSAGRRATDVSSAADAVTAEAVTADVTVTEQLKRFEELVALVDAGSFPADKVRTLGKYGLYYTLAHVTSEALRTTEGRNSRWSLPSHSRFNSSSLELLTHGFYHVVMCCSAL